MTSYKRRLLKKHHRSGSVRNPTTTIPTVHMDDRLMTRAIMQEREQLRLSGSGMVLFDQPQGKRIAVQFPVIGFNGSHNNQDHGNDAYDPQ